MPDPLDDARPGLPLDGDGERRPRVPARPAYRQPVLLLLVLLGGAGGTLARWATGLVVPHVDQVPLGTLAVNVVGAFVLGLLLEHLGGRGPDAASGSTSERHRAGGAGGRPPQEPSRRRALRVTFGTGFCGGFTTYSALANDTAGFLREGLAGRALAYVGATLVLGFAATVLGIALGRRRPGRARLSGRST